MNITQLKVLPVEEAVDIINEDLKKIALAGKMTSSFGKEDEVEGLVSRCSWTSITNHFTTVGYKFNRKTYQLELNDEVVPLITQVNSTVEPTTTVEIPLSEEEISFIKELYMKSLEEGKEVKDVDVPTFLMIKPKKQNKKNVTINVYEDTWALWLKFKEQYAYNQVDLLDVALREFITKYKLEEIEEDNQDLVNDILKTINETKQKPLSKDIIYFEEEKKEDLAFNNKGSENNIEATFTNDDKE